MLLAAALGGGYVYLDYAKHFQSTDDAFVAARQTALAPKVSGYLTAVPVTDNEHVAAGDVIARIDDRDYRIALEQAEAQVAAAQAGIDNIDAQLQVQQAQISANEAQVDQAQAALVFAQQQAVRYQHLAQTGYRHRPERPAVDLATAPAGGRASQRAGDAEVVAAANRGAEGATQQRARKPRPSPGAARPGAAEFVLHDGDGGPAGTRRQSQRRRRSICATGHEPDHVCAGSNLGHGELQGDSARPHALRTAGDVARSTPIRNATIRGHVDSVQPGSGTAFSLLPAQNATGNYVKIVQRVPVKIVMDDPPSDVALGPGMSVVPTVRVDPTPSLLERLRGWL